MGPASFRTQAHIFKAFRVQISWLLLWQPLMSCSSQLFCRFAFVGLAVLLFARTYGSWSAILFFFFPHAKLNCVFPWIVSFSTRYRLFHSSTKHLYIFGGIGPRQSGLPHFSDLHRVSVCWNCAPKLLKAKVRSA